ncbi:uncharacterized protein P884DRAFT_18753 [Thermothelomyces heterothallicus CBS 202.75]|uniref:uncharacterized protein n=1 Tax=Thermothelomyces heterothallicus CBS 202.75 TaxID=1149848 RepID=UPI003741EE59
MAGCAPKNSRTAAAEIGQAKAETATLCLSCACVGAEGQEAASRAPRTEGSSIPFLVLLEILARTVRVERRAGSLGGRPKSSETTRPLQFGQRDIQLLCGSEVQRVAQRELILAGYVGKFARASVPLLLVPSLLVPRTSRRRVLIRWEESPEPWRKKRPLLASIYNRLQSNTLLPIIYSVQKASQRSASVKNAREAKVCCELTARGLGVW